MGKTMIPFFGLCLCVLLATVNAEYIPKFKVLGRVYCDTCRAGYETDVTTAIAGAKVKIECKERDDMAVKYISEGITNSKGEYSIPVQGDRGDQICDVKLVSSPLSDCFEADPGRSTSRIILTNSNGLASGTRFANALGFLRTLPMSGCTKVLKKYEDTDE